MWSVIMALSHAEFLNCVQSTKGFLFLTHRSQHNYLRITRILKSLGELGFESYKLPLVHLLLEEALVQGTLANMRHSALEYFVYTLRKHSQRRALLRFAQRHYQPPENFIWGPPKRRGSPGTVASRTESQLDRSVRITRALKQGSPNRPDVQREGVDGREVGEWKTTKLSRSHQQGRGDTEEYIETVLLWECWNGGLRKRFYDWEC